ncbi:MAG: hypothetical protein ACNS60_19260 [Candidatus Cyclobacteriaceae bacterium M2_1C_046]
MQTTKLITGHFSPSEAKEILLTMVDTKINFHKIKSLSSMIRCNEPDVESEIRIQALKESKKQILEAIQHAADNNYNLKVESTIDLTFEPKDQEEEVLSNSESY